MPVMFKLCMDRSLRSPRASADRSNPIPRFDAPPPTRGAFSPSPGSEFGGAPAERPAAAELLVGGADAAFDQRADRGAGNFSALADREALELPAAQQIVKGSFTDPEEPLGGARADHQRRLGAVVEG